MRPIAVLTTRGRHYAYRVPFNWPSSPRTEAAIVYRRSARCAIVALVFFEINPQLSAAFPCTMPAVESVHATIHPTRLGAVNAALLCRLMGFPPPINGIKLGQSPIYRTVIHAAVLQGVARELFNYVNGPTCILFEMSSRATSRRISRGRLLSINSLPGHFKSARVHCARIAAYSKLDLCTVATGQRQQRAFLHWV